MRIGYRWYANKRLLDLWLDKQAKFVEKQKEVLYNIANTNIIKFLSICCEQKGKIDIGKDLKGKELGRGVYQRKDKRFEAKAIVNGIKIDLYDTNLANLKKTFAEAKREAELGVAGRFVNATLNEWFEFWFDTYKAPTIKKQSIRPMKNKYRNTFGKFIGHYKLTKLRNIDIQCALNELQKTDIAMSSIKEALGRITACLDSAKNNGIINTNPSFDIGVV